MDWQLFAIFFDGKFLGIEWHFWKIIGWLGNLIFSTRFFVQWYATEKKKQVTIPLVFWWLSLIGSALLLAYAIQRQDSVFIFAYALAWIPYIRNVMIHQKHKSAHRDCAACGASCPPLAKFCSQCGTKLAEE
jgi:lipid-A-disaccharide synthase-like uncharacterized protein